jgi:hypothetical protein
MSRYAMSHAAGSPPRHSADLLVDPVDRRSPGDVFLQQEIDANRRAERWLVLKAFIAIAFVAALVVVREVFFA